ncbi:MAG: DUF169 domain-containing protein [Euryarchaeota archaeon]|nr:DUF169 domain-containing protein [Euryarchaeota archaeon]
MAKKQINWGKIDETVRAYLGLRYHLVGIKIMKDGSQGEPQFKPEKPAAYCQIVRIASQGKALLFNKEDQTCPTAELCLGFTAPVYVDIEPRVKPADTKKVLVASIDQITEEPDVILAILTPRQMMDITTLLQAGKEELLSVGFRGEAACGEFTAKPYMEGKPNLSFLCNGARVVFSDYRDNEVIFGAPPEIYIQLAESIERLVKTGGALCGCRVSDIPIGVINEFEKIGLSKSTDYFFGRISNQDVRVYLNKDFQGKLKFITVHLPVKMPSDEKAEEATKKLEKILSRPYRASQRGYWLDLSIMASVDELGADIQSGKSMEITIKEVVNNMVRYLQKIGIKV